MHSQLLLFVLLLNPRASFQSKIKSKTKSKNFRMMKFQSNPDFSTAVS